MGKSEEGQTQAEFARVTGGALITKNLYYVAEDLGCFWLLHLYASHLSCLLPDEQPFTCMKLTVEQTSAVAHIEDGNGGILGSERIEYTDFPLSDFTLFGCWNGDCWVIMLPEDY